MKRLYILRHALTHPSGEGGDRERKLTAQGLQDARNLGQIMAEKEYRPEFILCSPVTRTRQTLDQVLESLGKIQTEYEKLIYEGGYNELLSMIKGANDKHDSLLIVGHNPSIHQLAASLGLDESHPAFNELAAGYPPGTLTVLDAPRASWKDVEAGENKLVDLIVPASA